MRRLFWLYALLLLGSGASDSVMAQSTASFTATVAVFVMVPQGHLVLAQLIQSRLVTPIRPELPARRRSRQAPAGARLGANHHPSSRSNKAGNFSFDVARRDSLVNPPSRSRTFSAPSNKLHAFRRAAC